MAKIIQKRMTTDMQGEFVVFLIGMRINKLWKVRSWWQVFTAMPKMLRELDKHPEMGLLGYRQALAGPRSPMVIEYWRSFEELEAYSRGRDSAHFPAWVKFNKTIGSNGDVGIWHETYKVAAGQYECVYNNVPPLGLGKVGKLVAAAGYRASAEGRITGQEVPSPVDEAGNVPVA
jgi:Domain of unknown function (DUF4188)